VRFVLAALVVALVSLRAFVACDDTSEPDCRDDACAAVQPDSSTNDGAPFQPTDDGSGLPPPDPFDAGTTTTPSCKGLFELCSATECCSPYGCTNGTCR